MTLVTKGLLQCLWFGFDAERFLLRVDTEGGPAARAAGRGRSPAGRLRRPGRVGDRGGAAGRRATPWPTSTTPASPLANGTTVAVATGQILELAVPFSRLGRKPGEPIRFYVELLKGETSLDRAPREGIFELTVPCPDFERIMWQV